LLKHDEVNEMTTVVKKKQIHLMLVIVGKSFRISGFLHELILNIEKSSTLTYTFFPFLE